MERLKCSIDTIEVPLEDAANKILVSEISRPVREDHIVEGTNNNGIANFSFYQFK